MASPAPKKSKTLHNFALPKWPKSQSRKSHRGQSSAASPPPRATLVRSSQSSDTAARRHSPMGDSGRLRQSQLLSPPRPHHSPRRFQFPMADSERLRQSPTVESHRHFRSPMHGSDPGHRRCSLFSSPPGDHAVVEKSEKHPTAAGASHKIRIRLPTMVNKVEDEAQSVQKPMHFREGEGKTRDFRRRNPLHQNLNINAMAAGTSRGAPLQESKPPAGQPPKLSVTPAAAQSPKFSVALTRQEIEEDLFSFSGGSRPNRRPCKKRAKIVQKHLDNLFPGLALQDVSPGKYKVSEPRSRV